MIRLIYISSATQWFTEDDLKLLLQQARNRNARQNVTGMLLYDNATFLQVLEGDEKDVIEIFETIKLDPRTNGIVTLKVETIEKRDFPQWTMGFRNLESCRPEELSGFSEIYQGKFDKKLVEQHPSKSLALLNQFANRNLPS